MAIRQTLIAAAALAVTAAPVFAQNTVQPQPQTVQLTRELCLKPENAERAECAALLENATNLVPLIGAGAGLLAVAAAAGGGGGGSTISTTGTIN
ncbi:hypothetical protein FGK63_16530 [Ruegeria sediminis]|uniref:Uncharacterized protein n=1 Tax=Ruegeria sediminis TaxID=2583820 RepID=A0ABY2WUF0_9RHOB|nr:hypothetical protein [Ruegeria sediminis]TMV05647.1 hypothetical protein FGK63_16530 [Ruegeria sediminis]